MAKSTKTFTISFTVNIKTENLGLNFETQAVRLFKALEFEILSGKLKPGQRLVRRDLSRRFNLSQATVSEALWRLESEGLAESLPMYGTRITEISLKRLQDELVMREALECEVARLLVDKIPATDVPRLRELAEKVDTLMQNAESYSREGMETHQEFHLSLARLTGSGLLTREVERVWQRHCIFFLWVSNQVLHVPPNWHRKLLDAILSGDADVAEKTMREHVLYGSNHQLEVLRKAQEASQNLPGEGFPPRHGLGS